MKYYDNLKTPIPENLFQTVVHNFHRGSCFFVEAIFNHDSESVPAVITPLVGLLVFFDVKIILTFVVFN